MPRTHKDNLWLAAFPTIVLIALGNVLMSAVMAFFGPTVWSVAMAIWFILVAILLVRLHRWLRS